MGRVGIVGIGHTVFGRVVEGMDVVAGLKKGDRIKAAKVLRKRKHDYKVVTSAKESAPATPAKGDAKEPTDADKQADGKQKDGKKKDSEKKDATKTDAAKKDK